MNSGEKQKSCAELDEGSQWSELEELGKEEGTFSSKASSEQKSETELSEERKVKISKAFVRVKEAYGKSERSRVERIKSEIVRPNSPEYQEYKYKQSSSTPSVTRKAIRLMADKLGIKTKRSEDRREREAMHVALSEIDEEQAVRDRTYEEDHRRMLEEVERWRREEEKQAQERREKQVKREEEEFINQMSTMRSAQHERIKKQRIQEIVERELNAKLLKVDDLEDESLVEGSGVEKRFVSFEDVDIPVYDLKGFPFSILSTTIDYRRFNKPGEIGTETYKKVMENPAVWAERRDEAEKASGFGTRGPDARGDTICTSYRNSERNLGVSSYGDLVYGFEKVDADSVIIVKNGDAGSGNMIGKSNTSVSDPDAISDLEMGYGSYNEITLRRYSEDGIPKKPDYIIVENGVITEESLRHAKFFSIPIINIERSIYSERAEKRAEKLLESIEEEDNYPEMIRELEELSVAGIHIRGNENIGLFPGKRPINSPLEERCFEIAKKEQLKRLEFIKRSLEKASRDIESATEKGLLMPSEIPEFDYFIIDIEDPQNQLRRTRGGDTDYHHLKASGNCKRINIRFKLKGGSRIIKTTVFDGERFSENIDEVAGLAVTEEEKKSADSSYYDALEPVVLGYFEAYRKNLELRKNPG
ncbi:hypothetical protein IJH24_01430 [Candidatus Saccharibacteria bacterium]|nr:hypothetical protein [Candidatus Saccharibacteria bacterium]